MMTNLKDILALAEAKKAAVPAFNCYNVESAMAVVQAAWAVAAVMESFVCFAFLTGMSHSMLASVRRAMASMVRTASTGYLPAAVSPESMMALVPS